MTWAHVGAGMALGSAGLLLVAPLGARVGLWSAIIGLALVAVSVLLALVAIVVSAIGIYKTGAWTPGLVGVVVASVALAVPTTTVISARGAPAIHDITTDPDDPPAFVAVLPLRRDAPNPPEYAGPGAAEEQRRAYPDLQPLMLPLPANEAFERAVSAARALEWEIVESDRNAGRIEAVDTTFWFGFKDDVVIRIREADGGSRIDVRSKSRVGRGDLGANATRIRALLAALRQP